MALKFLNKKGWHTGSLRNIENVWKAEQKHEAEQKKLEELKKQIQEERERSEFRQLQEQAGLVPKQERLEFLYDSGLAVGKSSESFPSGKPGEPQANEPESELSKLASAPGALFVEEKPASANDTWRKLHSDPLLMIRQREQESLAQIKNNPVKMEMIKKSLEAKKLKKEEKKRKKAEKKKRNKQKRQTSSASDSDTDTHDIRKKIRHDDKSKEGARSLSNGPDLKNKNDNFKEPMGRYNSNFQNPPSREHMKNSEKQVERRNITDQYRQDRSRSPSQYKERHTSISPSDHGRSMNRRERHRPESPSEDGEKKMSRSSQNHGVSICHRRRDRSKSPSDYDRRHKSSSQDSRRDRLYLSSDKMKNRSQSPDRRRHRLPLDHGHKSASHLRDGDNSSHARGTYAEPTQLVTSALPDTTSNSVSRPKYQAGKLSEEEKAAKLREMQIDAKLHDEQRLRRLKTASEADSREAIEAARRAGKNFLDATNKSVYGAEKGGSSTIEESVRRRTHYLQGSAAASEGNAFRR